MSKHILNELPELLNAGIIDAAAAGRIEQYYRQKENAQPEGRINIVFGIVGTVLVSLGIILIVAHNWDNFSRTAKLIFSFLPLLVGQLLCGYSLYKKDTSIAFKESSASFLFFAFGACLAMVSQLYHISETTEDILFTWMLVSFPLIYIMRSSMVSLLYIVGITAYAVYKGYGYNTGESYHYWWMLLLVIPYYSTLIKNRPESNFTGFHHWFIPLSLTICLGTVAHHADELLTIAYMSMFGFFYQLGTTSHFDHKKIFGNGYIVIGSAGTMFLLLVMSFRWFWKELLHYGNVLPDWHITAPESIAAILFSLAALVLLAMQILHRKQRSINYMGFIFPLFIVIFFAGISSELTAVIATNLLVLAAAIFTINKGNRLNHLGILNYGLLIITALVICRFFDTNISFVLRGLMFIGVGAGFFIANTRLLKKRKSYHEK